MTSPLTPVKKSRFKSPVASSMASRAFSSPADHGRSSESHWPRMAKRIVGKRGRRLVGAWGEAEFPADYLIIYIYDTGS